MTGALSFPEFSGASTEQISTYLVEQGIDGLASFFSGRPDAFYLFYDALVENVEQDEYSHILTALEIFGHLANGSDPDNDTNIEILDEALARPGLRVLHEISQNPNMIVHYPGRDELVGKDLFRELKNHFEVVSDVSIWVLTYALHELGYRYWES